MKKEDLIIIGAGNVGGFLAYNLKTFPYNVLGFLDDDPEKHGKVFYGYPVLGGVDDITKYFDKGSLNVIVGIANPKIKRAIVEKYERLPVLFPKIIMEDVWVSEKVTIGEGVILYPGVSINFESTIGDFVIINMNCAIGHNCHISEYSTLAPSVSLAGFTHLENCVDMGINSSTLQNVRIGNSAVIGGMAMVIDDIPSNCTAVGVPAKVIRQQDK